MSSTVLEAVEIVYELADADAGERVLHTAEVETVILTEMIPGMPGAPGADGTGAARTEFLTITNLSSTEHTLALTPNANSLQIFLNGLRERNWTLAGNVVDFTALDLAIGDELIFDYLTGA